MDEHETDPHRRLAWAEALQKAITYAARAFPRLDRQTREAAAAFECRTRTHTRDNVRILTRYRCLKALTPLGGSRTVPLEGLVDDGDGGSPLTDPRSADPFLEIESDTDLRQCFRGGRTVLRLHYRDIVGAACQDATPLCSRRRAAAGLTVVT